MSKTYFHDMPKCLQGETMYKPEKIRHCIFTPYAKGSVLPSFSLTLYDLHKRDSLGKNMVGYRLTMGAPGSSSRRVVFEGEDFACSPMHAIDSDECVEGVMGFLTLRPGDTDADYFRKYTPIQLEFCGEHAEALALCVYERFRNSKED